MGWKTQCSEDVNSPQTDLQPKQDFIVQIRLFQDLGKRKGTQRAKAILKKRKWKESLSNFKTYIDVVIGTG